MTITALFNFRISDKQAIFRTFVREISHYVTPMIKALFLDIDGTLVSFATHTIPVSTQQALRQAHDHGVKIIIATGRPYYCIDNLSSIQDLIDGYICTNGSNCFVGQHTVHLQPLPDKAVHYIMQQCDLHQIPAVIVGIDKVAVYHFTQAANEACYDLIHVDWQKLSSPLAEVLQEPVVQISPLSTAEQESEFFPNLQDCLSTRWCEAFSDITPLGVDKGKGIGYMAHYLGFPISETMALGDGGNDVPMFQCAGIGVAMGQSQSDVQAQADYVTSDVDHEGVAQALRHFGIID
jgi:Cof subfamily protein (haloacid dehalogenase superfamily)